MAKYCGNCGNEVNEKAYVCVKCGVVVGNDVDSIPVSEDNGGFGWSILGFLVPLVGLILYLVWKDEKPKCAKAIGKGALISTIIGVVIYILMMLLIGIIFWAMASGF